MSLIVLNGYTTPNPSTYEVTYSDINGIEDTLEDGSSYIEQIKANIPEIKVGWTNLSQEEVIKITDKLANATVTVQYFYGGLRTAEMKKGNRNLKLKSIDSNTNYWDLSLTLKG